MSALTYLEHRGNQLLEAGDYEEAWTQYLHALSLREKNPTTKSSDLEISLNRLDCLLDKIMAEDPLAARPFLMRGLRIWQRLKGKNHPETAALWHNLGYSYKVSGNLDKALASYELAFTIWKSTLPQDHPHLAACSNNLGALHKEMGNLARSLLYYQQALTLWQLHPQRYRDEIAIAKNNLGALLCQTDNWAAACKRTKAELRHHKEKKGEDCCRQYSRPCLPPYSSRPLANAKRTKAARVCKPSFSIPRAR